MYLPNQNTEGQRLTFREKEVFMLRTRGYDRKQIASLLNIAEGTVKKHLENIHQKLGVSSQVELMNLAIKSNKDKKRVENIRRMTYRNLSKYDRECN